MKRVLVFTAAGLLAVFMACGGSGSSSTNGGGNGNNGGKDAYTQQDKGGNGNGSGFNNDATDPGQGNGGFDVPANDPGPGTDTGYDWGNTGTDPGNTGTDPGNTGTDPGNPGTDNGTDNGTPTCLDCRGYLDCIGQCPQGTQGQGCIKACGNQACAGAAQAAQGFVGCIQKNCAQEMQSQNGIIQISCLVDKCLDQFVGCYHGDNYKTCVDIVNCMNGCPKDNPQTPNVDEQYQCIDDCRSTATEDAAKDYWHLIGCGADACKSQCNCQKNDKQCWDGCDKCFSDALESDNCKPYLEKCTPHGDQTCGQIMRCMNGCPKDNPATTDVDEAQQCIQGCFGKGSMEAQNEFTAWQKCAVDACKNDCQQQDSPQCKQCWNNALTKGGQCYDKLETCYKDIPSGNVHCKETMDCQQKAKTFDEFYNCEYQATKEAQNMLSAIQDCIGDACKDKCQQQDQQCQQCIQEAEDPQKGACKDQINACLQDNGSNGGGQ